MRAVCRKDALVRCVGVGFELVELRTMGLPDDQIASAVRFSWGPGVEEIPLEALLGAVSRLRC